MELLVSRRIVIKTVSFDFSTQITGKMSSSKTNYVVAKMMCVVFIISLIGSRIAVNGGVVIRGPSSLLSSATAIHTAVQNGQITPAQGHQQAQYLIQANKHQTNLAVLNGKRK